MTAIAERNMRATTADVSRRAGLEYEQGKEFVEAIVQELMLGREVRLQGLGVLRLRSLKARTQATPIVPGGLAHMKARRVARFHQAPTLKARINADLEDASDE